MLTYKGIDHLVRRISSNTYGPINALYLEFSNASSPPVITPDPSQDVTYFLSLNTYPDRDFVRIPLLSEVVLTSTDSDKFTANSARYIVSTEGYTAGYHSLPFSSAAGSKIYGVALVATQSATNLASDIVVAVEYGFTAISLVAGNNLIVRGSLTLDDTIIESSSS